MKRNFISTCLLALSSLTCLTSYAKGEKALDAFISQVKESNDFVTVGNIWHTNNAFDKKEMLKNVEKGQALTIDFARVAELMQKKTTAIDLVVPGINGGTYTLELARYDFFTNDFEVHEMGANGDKLANYTPGLYYRGIVKGHPGSLVAFSFFNNEVYGVFSIDADAGNYVLAPNTMTGQGPGNTNYILYNDNDIKFKDRAPMCGTDQLPDFREAHKTTTTPNNNVYNNCTEVRCFELVDYTMYVKKTPSSVTTSTNYITALFNAKSTIYRNEGVPIVLKYLQINTATDNYASLPTTSSSIWLDTFGKRTQNVMHGCDQATLFTTKGGSMGGVAWLGTMCMPYQASSFAGPYAFCNLNNSSSTTVGAFPTYSWEVEVSSHEMGHNLGSPHTHKCCWNPPARNTAIDGCYTIEGTCADPGDPGSTVGGTIMSYCHLTSSGIKFVNGFGPQPGDTVRYFLANTFGGTCGAAYHPGVALATTARTISANRECTDMSTGTTYYWNDRLTASHADDTLVLMIKKNGNNIGNLDSTGFAVSTSTTASWGTGTAQSVTFPAGTTGIGASTYSMRRYWKVTPKAQPTSSVEVIFPFVVKDSADLDGSVTGAPLVITNFKMYKVNSPIDPNPVNGFTGSTSSSFTVYTNGILPSTSLWSLTRSGDTCFAHMLMTNLAGGSGIYTIGGVGIDNVNVGGASIYVYPNPTNNEWFVSVAGSNSPEMTMQIFAADGKLVHFQTLQTGSVNTVSASNMPTGMYYYRVISNESTYTGSLLKK